MLEVTRREFGEIIDDEHLSVSLGTSANPDRRRLDGARDPAGEFLRNELQHEEALAGRIRRARVVEEFRGGDGGFSLPPLDRLMLGFQPEMTAHVEPLGHKRGDHVWLRALEFHAIGPRPPQDVGAGDRHFGRVIGGVRQVADQVDAMRAAPHGRNVMGHVGKRHLALMGVAQYIHADAIAHEDGVDPGLDLEARGRRVISRDHDDFFAAALLLEERLGFRHARLRFAPQALSPPKRARRSGGAASARRVVLARVGLAGNADFLEAAAFIAGLQRERKADERQKGGDFAFH